MGRIVDGVVSKSILEKAKKGAASVDWLCVPPEKQLLPDSILSWVADFQVVSTALIEKDNFLGVAWADWQIAQDPNDPVSSNILSCGDAVALNKWLSLYVIETRKQDGGRYPATTLNLLLCGLKRYMKKLNPATPNFLDERDDRFAGLRGTRDVVAHKLCRDGIGASVKHTANISQEEEAQLWSEGVPGLSTPRTLLNATFYLNGKTMCLRGGQEHKALKGYDYVVYTENGSKNRSGSYKDKPDDNKVIKHYADSTLGEKCYHRILKLYFSKLPPKVFKDPEAQFDWKPNEKVPLDFNAPWFLMQLVGRNTLASMVKNMCSQIGVTGTTNHSLRSYQVVRGQCTGKTDSRKDRAQKCRCS